MEKKMEHQIINKIDTEKKKIFIKKTIFSFIIIFYMLIVIMFCAFSSINWTTSLFQTEDNTYWKQSIFAFLYISFFIPIIFGITFEINKLFFGVRNILSYLIILFIGLFFLIFPNTFYIVFRYFSSYLLENEWKIKFFIPFVSSLVVALFLLIIGLVLLIKNNRVNDLKQMTSLFATTFISFFGIFSITFIGLLKGWLVLMYFFMISSFFDVFAYIFGMLFGKNKMAPIISPKKTWEGFIAGIIFSTLISLIIFYLFSFESILSYSYSDTQSQILHFDWFIDSNNSNTETYKWLFITIMIICMCICSQFGDLFYSYIKRMHNIKDYSYLLKEHGGFLDRFDSSLMVFSLYTILLFFITAISTEELW